MSWIVLILIALALLIWWRKQAKEKTQSSSPYDEKSSDSEFVDENSGTHFLDAPQYDEPIQIWTGGHEFEFSYLNYDGSRNRRTVTVRSVEQNRYGDIYFTGHCHFKNAERTFKIKKIPTMVKVDGGQKYKMEALFAEVLELPMGIHPKVESLQQNREEDLLSRFASCAWEGDLDIEFDNSESRLLKVLISKYKHPYFYFETPRGTDFKSVRRINSYIKCKDGTIGKRKFIHEHLGIPTKGIRWD